MKKYKVRVVEDRKKYNVEVQANSASLHDYYLQFYDNSTLVASFASWVYFKEIKDVATEDR